MIAVVDGYCKKADALLLQELHKATRARPRLGRMSRGIVLPLIEFLIWCFSLSLWLTYVLGAWVLWMTAKLVMLPTLRLASWLLLEKTGLWRDLESDKYRSKRMEHRDKAGRKEDG